VTTTTPSIRDRIAALDWAPMTKDLDSFGCTIVKSVLTREECRSLAAMYERDDIFRSTIVMARHGFGRGEYKYWSYPLPEIVAGLRTALYPPLAAVANRWNQSMKIDVRYPETHEEYLERCQTLSHKSMADPSGLPFCTGDSSSRGSRVNSSSKKTTD